jgi:hypothetical protein
MGVRLSSYEGLRLNHQQSTIADKEVRFFDGVAFDHYFEFEAESINKQSENHQFEIDEIELHHLKTEDRLERQRIAKSIIENMSDPDSSRKE